MIIEISKKLQPEKECIKQQVDMDYLGIGFNSDTLIVYFVRYFFQMEETGFELR